MPHCFYVHSYRSPTKCHICKRLLKGLVKQGYRCKGIFNLIFSCKNSNDYILDCKMSVHKKCIPKVTKNCHGLLMQHTSPGKKINEKIFLNINLE